MRSSDAQDDDVLAQIDQRGNAAIRSYRYCHRAKSSIAQKFADQSPLGPKKRSESGLKDPEPVDRTNIQATEKSSDAVVEGVLEQPAEKSTIVLSDSANARAHSWDSSQGSDYAYSEAAAADEHTSADQDQEGDFEVIDQAIDLTNFDTEDTDPADDTLGDSFQHEDPPATVHHDIENQNHEVIELKDFEGHNKTDVQKAQPVTKDQGSPNAQESVGREQTGFSTPLEPAEVLSHKKRKRFGLFGVNLGPDIEPLVESGYIKPPQRLRDLLEKRRRDCAQKEEPKKRTRYNLRPRGLGRAEFQDPPPTRPSLDLDTGEDEELIRPRRMTRSMTGRKQERKPIPRSRAARKTAWAAMGITPKDEAHRSKVNRQIVEVVIPVNSRSADLGVSNLSLIHI